MKNSTVLQVKNIKKSYPGLPTLDDITLDMGKKQFVSMLGPSGCGKSTLFNIISGLEKPDRGKVIIDGKDYNGKTGRVSYMHQKDLLLPWRNILDNVCLPLFIKGIKRPDAHKKARKYFPDFGLEGFEENYPYQLSGGMKQRAALLRTYLFADDIMLLDEPFGNLDAITRRKMQDWLLGLFQKLDASILFITHSIDEAIFLSDRIYLLSQRPARVIRIFDIELPRPRDLDVLTSPKFNQLKQEIIRLLLQEEE
jgi:ABC-type nitrate/sulfonate/bicarbonate transport system ATPase subunit